MHCYWHARSISLGFLRRLDSGGSNAVNEPPGRHFGLSLQLLSKHNLAVLELPKRGIGSTAQKMDSDESPVCLLRRRVASKQAIRQALCSVQRFTIGGIGHAQALGKPLGLIVEALPMRGEKLLNIIRDLHASQQLAPEGAGCSDAAVAVVFLHTAPERVDVYARWGSQQSHDIEIALQ